EEYTAKDGAKRRDPVIVADRVSFGAKPRGGEGGGSYGGGAPRQQSSYNKREAAPAEERYEDEGDRGTADDLPF
ncbi:single-stranded DNA-binding protein, partial [Candidatus Sumerlaeota bacterium]|nr:single-stranded DNA-binding protein [Candidatus Sumerlaeota bacterium]